MCVCLWTRHGKQLQCDWQKTLGRKREGESGARKCMFTVPATETHTQATTEMAPTAQHAACAVVARAFASSSSAARASNEAQSKNGEAGGRFQLQAKSKRGQTPSSRKSFPNRRPGLAEAWQAGLQRQCLQATSTFSPARPAITVVASLEQAVRRKQAKTGPKISILLQNQR